MSSSTSLCSLTLCVERNGALEREVFVRHGITLGRNPSNAICIDEPGIERIHSRVVRQVDGSMALECEGERSCIEWANGVTKRAVTLTPGTTFKIGGATIRCVRREPRPPVVLSDNPWAVLCPKCHEILDRQPIEQTRCPSCGAGIFYFPTRTHADATPVDPQMEPDGYFEGWLPRQVGPYRIRAFVARGGMGIVLRGFHQQNNMPASVKLIFPGIERGDQEASRFTSEVEILKTLKHPNVVRLQDYGTDGRLLWLAMDWVDGDPLSRWTAAATASTTFLKIEVIEEVIRQSAAGLSYLHSRGIIHRDVKPSNVLIAREGVVKVADLGIAKTIGWRNSGATRLTRTGTVAGTENYMAPEQAAGNPATTASDIFSLGMVWYEMLTNRRAVGAFVSPEAIRDKVPTNWPPLLLRCLSSEPNQRPNAQEFLTLLDSKHHAPSTGRSKPEVTATIVERLGIRQVLGIAQQRLAAVAQVCASIHWPISPWPWAIVAVGFFMCVGFGFHSCSGVGGAPPVRPAPPLVPVPVVLWHETLDYYPHLFTGYVVGKAVVRNDGTDGTIRVSAWVTEDATQKLIDFQSTEIFLHKGEQSGIIEIDCKNANELSKPHHSYIAADIPK
jgi:ssDNA-binding Zn-finger/Zn-ribbon topoisomerase 1/predicted Ser/Thr protein kinase